jgi:hypothetical protein
MIDRWIKEAIEKTKEPSIDHNLQAMGVQEIWHFVGSKTKRWVLKDLRIVAHGELLPGLRAVVMLQHFQDFTTKSHV